MPQSDPLCAHTLSCRLPFKGGIGDFRFHARREPLYDINPQTGVSIEVFYADRALESFGRRGAGLFWWCVCTENLNPEVVVMESAKDGERF